MESTIFKFIYRYSRREQIFLLVLTLVSFPFLYFSLDLPKIIINEAIDPTVSASFPREFLGGDFERIPYLLVLCFLFLALVLVNGAFKYCINVYRGVVGERMLRRLRYELFNRVLRFPLPQFRKTSQGEIVSMIAAETEPLGGFVGDSFALPAFQGGTLLTILVFMFVQDWKLGLAAIALYPLQMWIIPKLQQQVNLLKKERTIKVRKLSERIGEVVSGIQEVHAQDTSRYELADYSERMSQIYGVRYEIYRKKFLIKFLNNFIAQITPFFFFSIGGALVIRGELSFGALVAVLAAYKDLSSPWKELLTYYQQQSDARIKYELLADTFQPPKMIPEEQMASEPTTTIDLGADIVATNLDFREDDEGDGMFAGTATFKLPLARRVGIVGTPASGKDRLAMLLAGLRKPLAGTLKIDSVEVPSLPESVTGRQIAYVGQEPRLRSGTVRENLYYGLKHRPQPRAGVSPEALADWEKRLVEAQASGNSEHDIFADWVDYAAAGASGPQELTDKAIEVLTMVDMDESIYQLGLQGTADPAEQPELTARILAARAALHDRLADPSIASLVEPFDKDSYNTNMSVAENLLFGTPSDSAFDLEDLSANAYVRKVLHEEGLMTDFVETGRKIAEVMVDLFADVEPGSELFEQFSFISADHLPEFKAILARTEPGKSAQMDGRDRTRLVALPFRMVIARHRLGLIDESLQARILRARQAFARGFGEGRPAVEPFEPERYNPRVSIQDNILFGRLAYGKARGLVEVGKLIREVIEKLDLRRAVMEVGLEYPVGIAGMRLSAAQRQKLAIARGMLKRPKVMIVDEATAALDAAAQTKIMKNLLLMKDRGLIWVLHRASLVKEFDHTLVLESGKVVQQGRHDALLAPGSPLSELMDE